MSRPALPPMLLAALAALAALGSLAPATASACADADVEPGADNAPQVAGALMCLMNNERSSRGLVPLRSSAQLRSSARYHVDDMAFFHYFAHQRHGGPSVLTRIRATGYFDHVTGGLYTENLADAPEGQASARAVLDAWMQSDHHRANLLTRAFRDAGVAIALVDPHPAFYADLRSVLFAVDYGRRYRHKPRACNRPAQRRRAATHEPRRVCRRHKARSARR